MFSLPRVVPCFPLLGLTPSGLFMGLSSTIIYTSELILWFHNLFRERLSYKNGQVYATMLKVIIGNGGFYGCLSEPQGVSAWWKEMAQTCIRSFPFIVAKSH